jgi:multiple sugar transport system permease protein
MAGPDYPLVPASTAVRNEPGGAHSGVPSSGRVRRIGGRDRLIVLLMVLIPTLLVVGLVWLPSIATVTLSFAQWNGIGGISDIKWIGTENYHNILTNYPAFPPAIKHNVLWLAMLFLIATPFGMFLAVLVDKDIKGSKFYQTAIYLPVVLSLALVGFIWQLFYSTDQGLLNAVLGTKIDWYGDSSINIWAVMVAASWRHVGYIMLLYLAGLKGVDPSLREAAAVDGATEVKTFFRIVFPVLRPINVIVLVITVIESLRAFDLVWVVNKGRNGLELISALVTQNVVGEASRIGFGSALATIMLVISLVFITIYLFTVMREEEQ